MYDISCLKKHILLVWLHLGERKMDVAAAEHWSQDHVSGLSLRGQTSFYHRSYQKVSFSTEAVVYERFYFCLAL